MTRLAITTLLLAGVYLLALGSAHPWDAAAGVLIGAAVVVGLRRHLFTTAPAGAITTLRRAAAFAPFALVVLRDAVIGSLQVAAIVAHLRPRHEPGIVRVPLDERTDTGVAVAALVASLTPGEFVVDLDWDERAMLVHMLDARDPATARDRHDRLYRRYQRHVFP